SPAPRHSPSAVTHGHGLHDGGGRAAQLDPGFNGDSGLDLELREFPLGRPKVLLDLLVTTVVRLPLLGHLGLSGIGLLLRDPQPEALDPTLQAQRPEQTVPPSPTSHPPCGLRGPPPTIPPGPPPIPPAPWRATVPTVRLTS